MLGQFKVIGPDELARMRQRHATTHGVRGANGKTIELGFSPNAISDYRQAIEHILTSGKAEVDMYSDITAARPIVLRSPRP
jgi:hypothetical protein